MIQDFAHKIKKMFKYKIHTEDLKLMNMKKTTALIMSLSLIIASSASVSAEPENNNAADGGANAAITQNEPSYTGGGDIVYIEDDSLTPPDILGSQAALLIDTDSGRLLYGKNIDVKLFPASLTKVMTAIIALEQGNLEDIVTVPYQAISSINYLEDSNMGLLSEEQMSLDQLVSAMLIHSANDAANVIAFHISGSLEGFVEIMNNKAAELGMSNTHFENACGSHNDNHYTTARDMAALAQYAMKNEKFREIVRTPVYTIPPTNRYTLGDRIMVNTNLLLGTSRSLYQYYAPATGIKTGHTSEAGYCLISSASYSDMNLIAVTMKCDTMDEHNDPLTYADSRNLFEFAFANYMHQQLAVSGDIVFDSKVREAKNDSRVALTVPYDLSALVPSNADSASEIVKNTDVPNPIQAPIKKGDVIGTVTYTYKGTQIGTAELIATNDVELNYFLHVFNIIVKVITSPFFFIPVALILLLALYMHHIKKKKERKRRIQQIKKSREAQNDEFQRNPASYRKTERIERQRNVTKNSNSRFRK